MAEERLYRVFSHHHVTHGQIEHLVRITVGEDILKGINDFLSVNCEELFIVDEIWEIPKCEGCQSEAPGQRDHMLHPDGCLHDPSDCDFCQMELKNLIKLSKANNKDGPT